MSAILLVEDNKDIRELIGMMLGDEGLHVIEAGSGQQALTHARGAFPDLVITDWTLPDLSGVDLVRRLRAAVQPRTPILVLSGALDARAAVDVGATAYLPKPFEPDELIGCIRRLLAQR